MADNYRQGDHWIVDDETGQKVRASDARMRWDGMLVDKKNWEPRQPQDLIRSRPDGRPVSNPRPRPPDVFQGPLTTVIAANHAAGAFSITVETTTRMLAGDRIAIMLDDGDTCNRVIQTISSASVLLITQALPGACSIGKQVIDYTAMAEADVG